jgi:hypothetical protein
MKVESKFHILTQVLLYMGSSLQFSATALQLMNSECIKNYNDTRVRVSIFVFPPMFLKLSNVTFISTYFTLTDLNS